jgi:hypothetical protein
LGFQLDSKLLMSLIKNILDGEHKQQPLQWPGQQCLQQQLIDGVAPGHTKLADASSAPVTPDSKAELSAHSRCA